jgi:hypothetical protein
VHVLLGCHDACAPAYNQGSCKSHAAPKQTCLSNGWISVALVLILWTSRMTAVQL